jgi:hypothetical protein
MEIRADQLDEATLLALAAQAVELLCARDFAVLTDRFVYALAYGRDPAAAVASDLASCLEQVPRLEALFTAENARYRVDYFQSNDVTLHAAVECRFGSPWGDALLVDMVVVGNGRLDLALESIIALPADTSA